LKKLKLSRQIFEKNPQTSNLVKIRATQRDGKKDRQTWRS